MKDDAAFTGVGVSIRILALALVLSAAVSCASTKGSSPETRGALFREIPTTLQKGASTQEDATVLLGEPDRKRISPEGETWVYGEVQDEETFGEVFAGQAVGVGVGFIPVPYVGTAFSLLRSAFFSKSRSGSEPSAAILFDPEGLVADYAVSLDGGSPDSLQEGVDPDDLQEGVIPDDLQVGVNLDNVQ